MGSPQIDARGLCKWADDKIAPRVRRAMSRRRDVSALEVEEAWNFTLQWVWKRAGVFVWRDEDHAGAILWRCFRYALRASINRRTAVGLPAGISFPSSAPHEEPDDSGVRREHHPKLGLCRVDLSSAFDHLTKGRQDALFNRVVRRMDGFEAQVEMGANARKKVDDAKSRGLKQLRTMLAGEYRERTGSHRRWVPDPSEPAGFRWES